MAVDHGGQSQTWHRQRDIWLGDKINITELMKSRVTPAPPSKWNISKFDSAWLSELMQARHNAKLDTINCPALFLGDKQEVRNAKNYMYENPKKEVEEYDYISATSDCNFFKKTRGYITKPLSQEEAEFPIAFSILMYTGVEQVERLLRSIYMPQNFYCVHIDLKADDSTHIAMRALSRCFPNVFVASRLESVYWGHISILYAEMNCLRDLLRYQWKYFINLSGQMFPLHSNGELVKILKMYNGANDIEGTYKRSRSFWLTVRQTFSWRLYESLNTMFITIYPKSNPPYNVTIYKGSNQVAISRPFAVYLLKSKVARDLLEWFTDTMAPDEYLWPTLNHNPHLLAPGGYLGDPEAKTFTARASIWLPVANQVNWSWKPWNCQGKWVREICIFGIGDMPWLHHRPELFANKFFSDFEYLAYDCMEQLIFNRTLIGPSQTFDPTYYQSLPFVKYKDLVIKPDNSYTSL